MTLKLGYSFALLVGLVACILLNPWLFVGSFAVLGLTMIWFA